MNLINFNQTGGFPLTTEILSKLQDALILLNALGALGGEKIIISGCIKTGTIVSDGVVFVNNEVIKFIGGSVQTKVKLFETVDDLVFEDGSSKPTIRNRHIGFGAGVNDMNWSEFERPKPTKELKAIFENIANSLDSINNKLATIETGAQKQLPTDWDATNGVTQLLNKPQVISYLHKGVFAVGDVAASGGNIKTVNFPNVGTSEYMVIGSLKSVGSNWDSDNEVGWMYRETSNSSFKLLVAEFASATQDLIFNYMLIPL